jgi:hypothetical protein
MIKAICNEPIVVPNEKNMLVEYEPGQEFEMDEDIYEALKEAGLKIEMVTEDVKNSNNTI